MDPTAGVLFVMALCLVVVAVTAYDLGRARGREDGLRVAVARLRAVANRTAGEELREETRHATK